MLGSVSAISRLRIGVDGDGVTTLVVLKSCPLRCKYCLNPQTLSPDSQHEDISAEALYERVRIDELYFLASGGGVTFGGGEPLLQYEFIKQFRRVCGFEWKINVETSLNVPRWAVENVTPDIDTFIIDIKDSSSEIYRRYTGRDNTAVLENLKYLADAGQAHKCTIKIPLIPGYNSAEDVSRSEEFVRSLGFENIKLFTYNT